jgi:hypothetical protein
MPTLTFARDGLVVSTCGMVARGLPEMRVQVREAALLPECEFFLQFVADYLADSGKRIKSGETLNYGYWLVKFQAVRDDLLEVWEYNAQATEFVLGGSLALSYWRDQHQICSHYGADFSPPRADKLTAVSVGVMEGLPVQAVRYPWQEHMSGWLLVTAKWDGNVKSVTNHHTYHVTAARPDLARFLALPIGFRFDLTKGQRVWIDEEVANQPRI